MRRKRARTIYWLLIAGSAAMAVVGPRLSGIQATAAVAFVPVSHPANRFGNWLAGTLAEDPPLDPVSPDSPRELREIAEENQRLREQVVQLQGDLDLLQQIHEDREALGKDVLPRCSPLTVVGVDGEVLQVLNRGRNELQADMKVLHYGGGSKGIAGVISAVGAAGAQVRLISDPAVRVTGAFARFDETTDKFIRIETEPPLIEGAGEGMCQVARMRREVQGGAELAVGDWALLADSDWPMELVSYRIGEVVAIEDIPDEPGFARVLIRPPVELHQVKELMVMSK